MWEKKKEVKSPFDLSKFGQPLKEINKVNQLIWKSWLTFKYADLDHGANSWKQTFKTCEDLSLVI